MAPIGTLYAHATHSAGSVIRAIAAYGDLELKVAEGFVFKETNKTPEYIAKFPPGKVPAFEGPNNFYLFEAIAIARYVAGQAKNSTLLGTNEQEAALVDQWISFAVTELSAAMRLPNYFARGVYPFFKPLDVDGKEKLVTNLKILEAHLKTRTFLVGHRISSADIYLSSILKNGFSTQIDASIRQTIPNIVRYYNTVVNHPKIKPIFGETVWIEKAIQYSAAAKPKKVEAPKAAAAPAPPKEKAPKPAEDDEEEEESLVPQEPKVKNPLDDLPKSNFNLEDWKRAYSNMDTRGQGGSLEWFYQKFDKEGFSIWKVQFKYNEELTQVFMSSNQIGGFFNRLEGSRKYLFGSMGVLGTAGDSILAGAFILRGLDIKPVVEVAPDWESYTYEKIDLSNEEQRAYFEAALAWDLEIGGKKWADGKNFK